LKKLLILLSLNPSLSFAWEDTELLQFIMRNNPVLQSHHYVVEEYQVPNNWLDKAKNGTSFVARATAGGSEYDGGATSTVFGGVSISIPLSSVTERKEVALKRLNMAVATDNMKDRILSEVAKLRQMEADLEESTIQSQFWRDKLDWAQKRVEQGYSGQEELWTIGQKINTVKAAIAKLNIKIKTQQHILSHYAGENWETVLAYLQDKGKLWS